MPNGYGPERYESEMEELEADRFAFEEEAAFDNYMQAESPFEEVDEMELAARLLDVTDEAELEQFIGAIGRTIGQKLRKAVSSRLGRAVGGYLKGAARQALSPALSGLGTALGGPAGGALGSTLASAASRIFGLELEGRSPEDQEFDAARQFVRFMGSAWENAAEMPPNTPPQEAAKAAVVAAAQQHAPGLLRAAGPAAGPMASGSSRKKGVWYRQGNKIILIMR